MVQHIEVPLDLPDVRILRVEREERGDFVVYVESTRKSALCHKCKREINSFHGLSEPVRLRHLDLFNHSVYIVIQPKRYVCRSCDGHPTTNQRCKWYKRRSQFTQAFEKFLLIALIGTTVAAVARKYKVGYCGLQRVLDCWCKNPSKMKNLKPFDILGIDEISRRKGHKDFLAIITTYNSKTGELEPIGLLADRKKATVKRFLRSIPKRLREKIETVCIDLNKGYRGAVKEVLPNAKLTADRFHVAKLYRKEVDNLRKKVQRKLKKELAPEKYKELKGALQPFRKDDTNLEKSEPLKKLFGYSPELKMAYDFRKELTAILNEKHSKEEGSKLITELLKRTKDAGLTCFDKFTQTFETWKDEITNYFIARRNSGFVEGFNNCLKALKRRCFGFLDRTRFLKRLKLDKADIELLRTA